MKNNYFSIAVCKSSFLRILFVLLFVTFLCTDLFPQISRSISFPSGSLLLTNETAKDNNEYLHVSLASLQRAREQGKPELPVKYLKLLLPPNTKVKEINITNVKKTDYKINYKIFPGQLPEPTAINSGGQTFISPDKKIYESVNPYPAKAVQVVNHSYFDGNNSIVTIAIYPAQYFPLENKIEFSTDITYSLVLESYTGNISVKPKFRAPEDQKVYDDILKAVIDNQEDIPAYQIKPLSFKKETSTLNQLSTQDALPFYKYVIVTTNTLKNSFKKFVDWKRRKGLNIGVVTIEDILANYTAGDLVSSINDPAGNLRQYLGDGYASGVTMYALLADSLLPNNQHSVALRYGCGTNNTWDYTYWEYINGQWVLVTIPDFYKVPNDLYFSEFSGNWNVDGADGDAVIRYGELTGDDVSYSPNIFVGRMYFANSTEVANWTQKEIEYEQNPFKGNYSNVTKNLWSISDDMQYYNQDAQVEAFIPTSISNTSLHEVPGPYATATTAPLGTDVINALNTGYGFYNIYNHGMPDVYDVSNSGNNKRPWKGIVRLRTDPTPGGYEEVNSFDNITANNTSTIVYSIACDVAQPDYTIRSLGDIYTTLSNSGGTAFLGNTKVGWVSSSYCLHEAFVTALYNGGLYNLGQAEAVSKYTNTAEQHFLALSHNLLGDPEMPIWTAIPSQLSSITVSDAGNSITVNAGTSGSKICVSSLDNGNSYYLSVNASSYSFSTSVRPLYITITNHNYIPYSAVTGGTISSNTTIYNNAKVLSNLTINSGVTLTVQPGVNLTFASGASLIVNGTLNAAGTSTDKITFDRSGASGTWNGIVFNSGSSGSIDYCNISHATTGITCSSTLPMIRHNTITNNTTGISVSNVGTPSNEISYNTIQSNTNRGINLVSTSPKIYNNTISNNAFTGISCGYYSSPYLSGNLISGHSSSGVYCSYYSSALFVPWNAYGYYWSAGYNQILDNMGTGISASYWSNLYLGSSPYGGYNSIAGNSDYQMRAYYGCSITAQLNWWGTDTEVGDEIYTYQSTVDFSNYLHNPPGQSGTLRGPSGITATSSAANSGKSDFERGYGLQLEGKFDEAIAVYDSYINANLTDSKSAYALVRIDECYKLSGKEGAVTYLDNTIKTKANKNNELNAVSLELKNQYLIQDKRFEEAVNNLNKLAETYNTNKEVEKHSLFNAGYVYLKYLNDYKNATDKFAELAAKYPDDDLVFESKYLLGEVDANSNRQAALPLIAQSELIAPTEYDLEQNYPNPFNPITTITYQLPKTGNVTLKIYDMLGKEVKTLVNEQKEMGKYTVQFDASSLASGMYIYQLRANDYTSTKKMLLLK
ncbi:MAG: C25 family cysteine peptidase [Ignavibacteria bacterium]|nr:C25 family cysteine peptidase [Ignavibacteria bacterium]